MSRQDIGIAVRQRTAITPVRESTMTSPCLDHIRPTRSIIKELIAARAVELAKTTATAPRQRVERESSFLRDELARLQGETKPDAQWTSCDPGQTCPR